MGSGGHFHSSQAHPKVTVKEPIPARWPVRRPQSQRSPYMPCIWGTGWQWKPIKTFFTSALTGEDPEKKTLGRAWNTWEWPMFPWSLLPVNWVLFLFLKCSRSGHLALCCKEGGQPFHSPANFSRHSRATMVEKRWMAVICVSKDLKQSSECGFIQRQLMLEEFCFADTIRGYSIPSASITF